MGGNIQYREKYFNFNKSLKCGKSFNTLLINFLKLIQPSVTCTKLKTVLSIEKNFTKSRPSYL